MNRIILIGNGFDKAHGLPTGYTDFINNYWSEFALASFNGATLLPYSNERDINDNGEKHTYAHIEGNINISITNSNLIDKKEVSYLELNAIIDDINFKIRENWQSHKGIWGDNFTPTYLKLVCDNRFLERISHNAVENWVDIENEYYEALKRLISETNIKTRHEKIKKLNEEFHAIKKLLEEYLTLKTKNTKVKKHKSIQNAFSSLIELKDIAYGKRKVFFSSIMDSIIRFDDTHDFLSDKEFDPTYSVCLNKEEEHEYFIKKRLKNAKFKETYCIPQQTLILNFNYTNTAKKLYAKSDDEIINIHGELNSIKNPIIFGYGDELDDYYKQIEKLQDNDFLENIKSIKYHKTRNYRNLLSFIGAEPYQVFIMGHSCGNSDRTLLNTLFEHENCISVKVYYRQYEDSSDDHENLIRNISRNFNDKPRMRDIVVNWEDCSPLVPKVKKKR